MAQFTLQDDSSIHIADAATFCSEVLSTVSNAHMNYIDAVVYICEKRNIDPKLAAPLISPTIREQIREEAMRLNLIKKTASLPF